MNTPNNPPAFPQPIMLSPNGEIVTGGNYASNFEGLSLRDYFAAKALQGSLANPQGIKSELADGTWNASFLSKQAYLLADSMLAEREKGTK